MAAIKRTVLVTNSLAISTVSLTLFLFGPINLYYTNFYEMSFSFSDTWFIYFLFSIAATIVPAIVVSLMKLTISEKIRSVFFVTGVLLWIQGNLFVWNIGILDGSEIKWGKFNGYFVLELCVWALLLSLALAKSSVIQKIIKPGSIAIIAIQSISITISIFHSPADPKWKKLSISYDNEFMYSEQNNIIFVVLDTYQTDLFQEMLNEDPNLRNEFQGFTYFRNATGGFPSTYASVNFMLTGKQYDNSMPAQQFFENSFRSDSSLPRLLKENGYNVELYPIGSSTVSLDKNIVSNVRGIKFLEYLDLIKKLYKSTAYKFSPILFKRYAFSFQDSALLHTRDLKFIEEAESNTALYQSPNTFKFIHIPGVHLPFQLNERLDFEKLEINREGYKTQAKAATEIMKRYLRTLKSAGIYDNSIIIIVGDHGSYHFGVNTEAVNGATEKNGVDLNSSIVGSGIPLILMKPPADQAALKVSDAPVTLGDIPKTVLSLLEIENNIQGESMFKMTEGEVRKRKFNYYLLTDDWNRMYLPVMEEYEVSGHSWLQQSWSKTYNRLTPGSITSTLATYQFGEDINFTRSGNSDLYKNFGWWTSAEDGFTWTEGPIASVDMRIEEPKADLKLIANFQPFIANTIDEQVVNVKINGKQIGEWHAKETGNYELSIPKDLINSTHLKVEFEMPNSTSPANLKIGDDKRELGIAMVSLKISEKPQYQLGSAVEFGVNGNAQPYQENGWSTPEENLTWIDGKRAALIFDIPDTKSLRLTSSLTPFITDQVKQQQVNIYANGTKIGEWIVDNKGDYQLEIPKGYQPPLRLEFEVPDAVSPKSQNISDDNRVLGVAVHSIVLNASE